MDKLRASVARVRAVGSLVDDRPAAVRRLAVATALMLVLGVLQLTVFRAAPRRHGTAAVAAVAPSADAVSPDPTVLPPADPTTTETAPPTTAAPPVTAAPAPAPTQPPAPPTTAKPRSSTGRSSGAGAVAVPGVPAATAQAPFRGLGTWVDVYDWSDTYTNGKPTVTADDIDAMVAAGVQTLYIQTARQDTPDDVLEPDHLAPIIARAKARHLTVVTWVLPGLEDLGLDMRHLQAAAGLGDALGVDIESTKVSDVNERNRRLVQLSHDLRAALPKTPIVAIVLPPVVLEVVNTNYWPNFPYHDIAPFYDVWMPMAYWTNRTTASGYRDAYVYTDENIRRLRADVGRADLPVHAAGGIGDKTTAADIDGFVKACSEQHCIGGSIYDWRTTAADMWPHLAPLRVT